MSAPTPCPWSHVLETPLGPMGLVLGMAGRLERLSFLEREAITLDECGLGPHPPAFRFIQRQLDDYFHGACQTFNIPLQLTGTPFQLSVWEELRTIPYGRKLTYTDLAIRLGDAKLARAVGNAAGQNPIAIIVPCHRLVGSEGHLGGYAAGIERKRALLDLEQGQPYNHVLLGGA